MSHPLFPPPDLCLSRCGRLKAVVAPRSITGAPDFMRGLRALFVSDIHVRPRTTTAGLEDFMGRIRDLAPDLLLLGGDYSDLPEGTLRFFEALRGVRPPLGCFGALGNNDAEAWQGRLGALREVMESAGCRLLINESAEVAHNGGIIRIAGIDELRYGRPDASGLFPASASPEVFRILLSHYPADPGIRPDLMLSGHTHGGQFNLLGLTPFAVGFERITLPRFTVLAVSGLHEIGGMKLLVSKGIGASRLQWRIGVRPEMDLLLFE